MAQVIIRNLDDETVAALKTKAARHGNSLEQELRCVLAQAAKPEGPERAAIADRIRAMTPRTLPTSSTALIREDRDR